MLNRLFLIGHLGTDPDLRYTPEGRPVASFRLAVTTRWAAEGDASPREETEWFTVLVYGQQAERCAQSLRKGERIFVEGRLRTRLWTGNDGKQRFDLQVLARRVLFLASGRPQNPPGQEPMTIADEDADHDLAQESPPAPSSLAALPRCHPDQEVACEKRSLPLR